VLLVHSVLTWAGRLSAERPPFLYTPAVAAVLGGSGHAMRAEAG
jgi:hypothetical protein